MCDWLRVATAFVKRRANSSTSTWDEEIYDDSLRAMLEDTVRRVTHNDPAKVRWDVVGEQATVWVGARSLTLGIVVEVDGQQNLYSQPYSRYVGRNWLLVSRGRCFLCTILIGQ